MPELAQLITALSRHLPPVLRWAGGIARELRGHDISVGGKTSGSANTDALTLADLSVQELIVAALRDADPVLRECRLEAEESTGDFGRFAGESPYTIAIDPIDGTKCYRDRTGGSYAVIVMLQSAETVHYSLVYIPETGPQGTWVEVNGDRIVTGPDDWDRPAPDVLAGFEPIATTRRPKSRNVYVIGFQQNDRATADSVTAAGLKGFTAEDLPGCVFELQARGEFAGSLIHTPNIYDFPVSMQIARSLGGDALWVHNREPVHLRETWLDDRADMLRLPGIVACSEHRDVLDALCELARDWDPVRYRE
jgi:3'(2'), 5'-bisphosphate nucleotidase